jgi:hypothetical protein
VSRGALDAIWPKATSTLARSSARCVSRARPADLVDLVDLEIERDDDAEARPGTTHRPEEIAVLLLVRHHDRSVGQDDPRRDEPIDGEAVRTREHPDAAGGRETPNPHRAAVTR